MLGGMPADQRTGPWTKTAEQSLLELFLTDPDPGVHSSAEWALRKWGRGEKLAELYGPLATGTPVGQREWFLTQHGRHTMVRVQPVTFRMGSEEREPDRDRDENPHQVVIPSAFYIATEEVTFEQFCKFRPSFREHFAKERMPGEHEPVVTVTWYDAIAYCRWLSEKEGIQEDQMCYPRLLEIKKGMKLRDDLRLLEGYRLPMEDEWEFACRAGAMSIALVRR